MTYEVFLREFLEHNVFSIDSRMIEKTVTFSEAIKNIEGLSWSIKRALKPVNMLYNNKDSLDNFNDVCRENKFEARYPLTLVPTELQELQKELEEASRAFKPIAQKLEKILLKSLIDYKIPLDLD